MRKKEGCPMITLQMTEEEAKILAAMLSFYLSDLRMEIADTERMSWRERMKSEEAFIKRLLVQLPES
jgi:hypothetical protein